MKLFRQFFLIQKRFYCISDDVAFLQASYSARYKKHRGWGDARYGGRHLVSLIPGNGIGPEMMGHVKNILAHMNCPVDFETVEVKASPFDVKYAIKTIRRNKCCIKGSIEKFDAMNDAILYSSPNVAIRKKLDLFCGLNIFKSFRGVNARHPKLDLIVIRDNVEGEYSMMEHSLRPGLVQSLKICTEKNTRRLARWAFQYAKKNKRKKVTIVHKANIMNVVRDCGATEFPDIAVNDIIVDNASMQIVTNPYQFDILICPNLYGSILCNCICGLMGGPGLFSASNFGYEFAAFETATRSTATELEGKNKANPVAFLNSAIDMLYYLGLDCYGQLLQDAIMTTIELDSVKTNDIGGTATTSEVIQKIKDNITIIMNSVE